MSYKWPSKDPDDIVDYAVDWTARLDAGDTISTSTFSTVSGTVVLNAQSVEQAGTKAVVWISGGADGEIAEILNRVVTVGGRQFDQTIGLKVKAA